LVLLVRFAHNWNNGIMEQWNDGILGPLVFHLAEK
jgi:hypothetical protein